GDHEKMLNSEPFHDSSFPPVLPIALHFGEKPTERHRAAVGFEETMDSVVALGFVAEAQDKIRVRAYRNLRRRRCGIDRDSIAELAVLSPHIEQHIAAPRAGQLQHGMKPANHERVLEMPGLDLPILFCPVDAHECGVAHQLTDDRRAGLAERVDEWLVTSLSLTAW